MLSWLRCGLGVSPLVWWGLGRITFGAAGTSFDALRGLHGRRMHLPELSTGLLRSTMYIWWTTAMESLRFGVYSM
ncbi:hypothetical protein BAUCODRAFT_551763 [Baudoinia panamericana UAMH 10762]|uniref:Uncharacterized protein n=1 Tax=Baudoinia panamericana (strain UAMH 10762) TaxID=717646 RepID=M2N708_BAUPA|nr:uncharacterized protein BAUCODRAFT_551763 [Baudoinia panamericana UAMH 10762]EMC94560.1 hypothetical protein BAUCODRAFT_551763 [Baudoinia panamericana UAMH 10762]